MTFLTGIGSIGPGWGNGKAAATLLARQGSLVFGIDIDRSAAEETKAVIEAEGGTCEVVAGDATSTADVAAAVAACVARFGTVDVLVNNVGGSAPGGPTRLSEQQWDEQIRFNLKSVYLGCHHVLPLMVARGHGVIVNLSSVAGIRQHVGRPQAAYSAAKAAIIELSRSIAIEHAASGIRCNAVVPGLMHTPLVEARLAGQIGGGDVEGLIASRHAKVPMGHMGDAWDVAHAVLFLASDEARYVTATALVVDGGYSAVTP